MSIKTTRPGEFGRVLDWFESPATPGRIDIFGLSGFGGIGKSYLLRHALDQVRPEEKGFLRITVDGSDSKILGQFMPIYDRQFAPKSVGKGSSAADYFPRARKLAQKYAELERQIEGKIDKADGARGLKDAANWLLRGGALLNRTIPKSREYLDFDTLRKEGLEDHFQSAVDLVTELAEPANRRWVPGPVKDLVGFSYSDRMRTDLFGLAADEWVGDVSAILTGYRKEDRLKITHAPVAGLERLLLIIDDFEILGKSIADFLVEALIPLLANADFHSTIIVLGRDDLFDSHIGFQHHLSHHVRDRIRLGVLPEEVAAGLFLDAGYGKHELEKLISESMCYPFLVSLLCEAKGGSVSFYKRFYDRTTRWMGETERGWVLPLCYLDRVTESTVALMLPDAPAGAVVDWFGEEASLRDSGAEWYVVAPYIRRTLLEYNERKIGPQKHKAMVEAGKRASAEA